MALPLPGGGDSAHGGGIDLHYNSSPTISNCTITENSADHGGGIWVDNNSSPTISNCTITGNRAFVIYGGGIAVDENSSPTITNCTITGNSAVLGGGIHVGNDSSPTITNCTVTGNSADHGGGIDCINESSNADITNCILWGNEYDDLIGFCSATYSDIYYGNTGGEGNIRYDPLFVDPDNEDYHLSPDSPCIDAGDNSAVPEWLTTDFEGDPRIVNDTVDMGADEFYEGNGEAPFNVRNRWDH